MKLFSDITVPSLVNQSCKPDLWLIFFDKDTPETTRQAFELLREQVSFMQAKYCDQLRPEEYIDSIRTYIPPNAQWLLTTRLDNDDALHPDFIATVQKLCRPGTAEFINPARGLIVADGRLYRKRDYSSPFISRSESIYTFSTVWIDQHQRLSRHGKVRQFFLRDAWIQVIHGENLANQIRGVRTHPNSIRSDVLQGALSQTILPLGLMSYTIDNSIGLARRYAGSAWRRLRRELADRRAKLECQIN